MTGKLTGPAWKPALALMAVTPILTELLSTNLPAQIFFQPLVLLLLVTVVYGFPVVLLRDLAVRLNLGLPGWLVLGVIYGILNEGVIAKTFYLETGVPVSSFDHYGYLGGIAIPWSLTISVWHALHAFVYPVIFVHSLFPAQRHTVWLGRKTSVALAAATLLFGLLAFLGRAEKRLPGEPSRLVLLAALAIVLLFAAQALPKLQIAAQTRPVRLRLFLAGMLGFAAAFLVPLILAGLKVPVPLFLGYWTVLAALAGWWAIRHRSLGEQSCLIFAAGDNSLLAAFALLGGLLHRAPGNMVTSAGFLATFAWFAWRIAKPSPHVGQPDQDGQ